VALAEHVRNGLAVTVRSLTWWMSSMTAARILIVEDFADSRDMYVEFLEAHGFRAVGVEDGPCLPDELLAAV